MVFREERRRVHRRNGRPPFWIHVRTVSGAVAYLLAINFGVGLQGGICAIVFNGENDFALTQNEIVTLSPILGLKYPSKQARVLRVKNNSEAGWTEFSFEFQPELESGWITS